MGISRKQQKMIYGFTNHRYFVPASNPYGHTYWYSTRAKRDDEADSMTRAAAAQRLSNASGAFVRTQKIIRTDSARSWLLDLQESGFLSPENSMSHSWEG